jgi:hypothetical protein
MYQKISHDAVKDQRERFLDDAGVDRVSEVHELLARGKNGGVEGRQKMDDG